MEAPPQSFVSESGQTLPDPTRLAEIEKNLATLYPELARDDPESQMLRQDYAQIINFLGSKASFNEVTRKHVDPLIAQKADLINKRHQGQQGYWRDPNGAVKGDKWMNELMYAALEDSGFQHNDSIYMTGATTGPDFNAVVNNKLLFSDGLSTVHGEYTHSLQWIAIQEAQRNGYIKLRTPLQTGKSLSDLYARAPMIQQDHHYDLPTETEGTVDQRRTRNNTSVWDYMVDCVPQIRETDLAFRADAFDGQAHKEHPYTLMSNEARSPAVVQYNFLFGDLHDTTVGSYMQKLYKDRGWLKSKNIEQHGKESGWQQYTPPPKQHIANFWSAGPKERPTNCQEHYKSAAKARNKDVNFDDKRELFLGPASKLSFPHNKSNPRLLTAYKAVYNSHPDPKQEFESAYEEREQSRENVKKAKLEPKEFQQAVQKAEAIDNNRLQHRQEQTETRLQSVRASMPNPEKGKLKRSAEQITGSQNNDKDKPLDM